jgi:hypothetical protein
MWSTATGDSTFTPPATKWDWIVDNTTRLSQATLRTHEGWTREDRPKCAHGPMVFVSSTSDESAPSGVKVCFRCHVNIETGDCARQYRGRREGYEPPAPRMKASKGAPGACRCTGACLRGCPCRAAGEACTGRCFKHKGAHSKCKNVGGAAQTAPAPS